MRSHLVAETSRGGFRLGGQTAGTRLRVENRACRGVQDFQQQALHDGALLVVRGDAMGRAVDRGLEGVVPRVAESHAETDEERETDETQLH